MAGEGLKARGLEPSLTVNDVAQSIRFYRDGLGFNVSEEMKGDDRTVVGVRRTWSC